MHIDENAHTKSRQEIIKLVDIDNTSISTIVNCANKNYNNGGSKCSTTYWPIPKTSRKALSQYSDDQITCTVADFIENNIDNGCSVSARLVNRPGIFKGSIRLYVIVH